MSCYLFCCLKKHFKCLDPDKLPCWEGYYKCYNLRSTCIYQVDTNNKLVPCENGRHLQYCKNFSCDSMFKCMDDYCIAWSLVCDGKWDCPSGEDELETSVCNKNVVCVHMYHCRNTAKTCLHLGNTCDGYSDFPHGDDELLCEFKDIQCPSFCTCIMYAIICRKFSIEQIEEIYPYYLSIHFINILMNYIDKLTTLMKYAIVLKLPGNEIIDICHTFSKVNDWNIITLDVSFNLLKTIKNRCFSTVNSLKALAINDNNILFMEKNSFCNVSNLTFLNITNNPIILLHHRFLNTFCLKLISITNVSFRDIFP